MSDPSPPGQRYSKGRWMIERERCRITDFKPPPPDRSGMDLAAGVAGVLKKMGLENESWSAELVGAWPSVVGKQVSLHTRPGILQGNELTVYVDSSVWLNELQRYGLKVMLNNIQERFGDRRVRKLRLQIDPDH